MRKSRGEQAETGFFTSTFSAVLVIFKKKVLKSQVEGDSKIDKKFWSSKFWMENVFLVNSVYIAFATN